MKDTSFVVSIKGKGYYALDQCSETSNFVEYVEKAKWFKSKENASVMLEMLMSRHDSLVGHIYEIEYEFVRLLSIKHQETVSK